MLSPLRRFRHGLALCLLLLTALVTPAHAEPRGPLVLAASSLQEALSAAAESWAKKGHPKPVLSFAASSALARQIAAKAPADLFFSADQEWMDYLAARNLIVSATRSDLLTNRLVIVAPVKSRASLLVRPGFPLAAALGGGRLALADPDAVPAGRYAKDALTRLKVWPSVEGSLARAENVRAALALVARGAAPLGIVYATDAGAEGSVRVVGWIPANVHAPIVYPLARLTASSNPEGEAFRRFLLSAEGKGIFRRYGFGTR